MPTQLNANVSAFWERLIPYVRDGSTWNPVLPYVCDAGFWRLVGYYCNRVTVGTTTNPGGWGYDSAGGSLSLPSFSVGESGLALGVPTEVFAGVRGVTNRDFWLAMVQSSSDKNAFSQLIVESSTGVLRTFSGPSADSYNFSLGQGLWGWGNGSSLVWNAGSISTKRIFVVL